MILRKHEKLNDVIIVKTITLNVKKILTVSQFIGGFTITVYFITPFFY